MPSDNKSTKQLFLGIVAALQNKTKQNRFPYFELAKYNETVTEFFLQKLKTPSDRRLIGFADIPTVNQ